MVFFGVFLVFFWCFVKCFVVFFGVFSCFSGAFLVVFGCFFGVFTSALWCFQVFSSVLVFLAFLWFFLVLQDHTVKHQKNTKKYQKNTKNT